MDSKHSLPELVEILEFANYITIREREEIAELIQQQDKMLELACDSVARLGCPMFEHEPCPEMTTEVTCSECWRKYLQSEVSK